LNPRHHEAQLDDQKPRKAQEGHLEEEENCKANKSMKSGKQKEHEKHKNKTQKLPLKSITANTLNASSPP
jgi:hypothetical protein